MKNKQEYNPVILLDLAEKGISRADRMAEKYTDEAKYYRKMARELRNEVKKIHKALEVDL